MRSVRPRGNRNSDSWRKCFTSVPPGASRDSADHNVENVLAASAMPWMGSLPALLTVANVVSVANSNFQLATLVLIIGNILTMATFKSVKRGEVVGEGEGGEDGMVVGDSCSGRKEIRFEESK